MDGHETGFIYISIYLYRRFFKYDIMYFGYVFNLLQYVYISIYYTSHILISVTEILDIIITGLFTVVFA